MNREQFKICGYFLEGYKSPSGNIPQEISGNILNAISDIGDCDIVVISHKLANKMNLAMLLTHYAGERKEDSELWLKLTIKFYTNLLKKMQKENPQDK